MQSLRPNQQRAKNAQLLIYIILGLEVVSFFSSYMQYNLIDRIAHGGDYTMEEADLNDLREMVIGILYVIAYIVSAVTFIQWFRRAYYNLHLLVPRLNREEGWAAGSWFVPILNLFWPYQIMQELYQKSEAILPNNGVALRPKLSTLFIGWWWALWVLNNLYGNFSFRISMHVETAEEILTATQMDMGGSLIGIPLCFLAVKVIRDYAAVESLLQGAPLRSAEKPLSLPPEENYR